MTTKLQFILQVVMYMIIMVGILVTISSPWSHENEKDHNKRDDLQIGNFFIGILMVIVGIIGAKFANLI